MNFETGVSRFLTRAQDARPPLRAGCTEKGSTSGPLEIARGRRSHLAALEDTCTRAGASDRPAAGRRPS
jgi:hypothetical protein